MAKHCKKQTGKNAKMNKISQIDDKGTFSKTVIKCA